MPHRQLLYLLSVLVFLLAVVIVLTCPSEYSSAIGSIFGAAAGLLAVLWFSVGLYYQSRQLAEQREQSLENFRQLREDNRRNALLMVKDILGRAEERALRWNPGLSTLNDLTSHYVTGTSEWPIILQSTEPTKVLEAGKKWITMTEGPARLLVSGI